MVKHGDLIMGIYVFRTEERSCAVGTPIGSLSNAARL